MPSALFYQPNCGISGDMHMAALLDLGVPEDHLRAELARLPVAGEFNLVVRPGEKMGITGTQVKVETSDSHGHRHHSTIVKMITDAGLSPSVTRLALDIFQVIAVAEGKIHGIPPEKVHFHEVGAVDSIVDIVGAAICIDHLAPDIVLCNPIEVGAGYVDCAHGRFPVPAPATQELLVGAPCTFGGVQGESTTPTGAAILNVAVNEYSPRGAFAPQRVGYGVGHKDFEIPNVLRAVAGEYNASPGVNPGAAEHFKIEANIDDMPAEAYGPVMDALFAAGAVDVYLTPIVMKKGRPAQTVTALVGRGQRDAVCAALLNTSSTIGLRVLPFEKMVLKREEIEVTTSLGAVRVKMVTQPDGRRRWKSEFDDIEALAQQAGDDYLTVKKRIDAEIEQQLGA